MESNNNLFGVNKSDNKSRNVFAAVSLFIVLAVLASLYAFALRGKGLPNGDNNSSQPTHSGDVSGGQSSSETEDSSRPLSQPVSEDQPSSAEPGVSSDTVSEEPSEPSSEEITEHGWVINNLGYTYLYYGIGLEQFTYSSGTLDKYANAVDTLYSVSGSSNFYHILIPTRCEFIDFPLDIRKEFYVANQRSFMNGVFGKTDGGVKNIDVYDVFKEKNENGEYIYFNTDPNYTHLGAYAAYAEYCKAAGLTAVSESFYTPMTIDYVFYGKFFTATGAEMLFDNPDIVYYYDVDEVYKSTTSVHKPGGVHKKDGVVFFDVPSYGYYCFLSDEAAKIEVTTSAATGKNALVIGDSSGAPFVTLLVPHYKKITYINSTLCTESILDLLSSGQYEDIIIINYNTTAARTINESLNVLAGIEK